MKIKKGDWFKCIKSTPNGIIKEGEYYQTEDDNLIRLTVEPNHLYIFHETSQKEFFVKLYTIQDLKNRKVAVHNDGTLKELRNVMINAFPEDVAVRGGRDYYVAGEGNLTWNTGHGNLPVQSVKDFFGQLSEQIKTPDLSNEAIKGCHIGIDLAAKGTKDESVKAIVFPKIGVTSEGINISDLFDRIGKRFLDDIQAVTGKKKWEPKVGEKIEADIFNNGSFVEAEYLATDERCEEWKYAVSFVAQNWEWEIENATQIRPVTKKQKVSKQEIADCLGIDVELLEIVD